MVDFFAGGPDPLLIYALGELLSGVILMQLPEMAMVSRWCARSFIITYVLSSVVRISYLSDFYVNKGTA